MGGDFRPEPGLRTPHAVDVKATATCNYQTTITATLTLWKCDSQPDANLDALNSGTWGCLPVATSPTDQNTRLALPGEPQTFQAPPSNGAVISPTVSGSLHMELSTRVIRPLPFRMLPSFFEQLGEEAGERGALTSTEVRA